MGNRIHKICKIQNVGVFKEYENNSLEFSDVNFVYANNASGKSTITDILKDLSEGNNTRIQKRRTIPVEGKQFIKIVYKDQGSISKEMNIIYDDKKWSKEILKEKIMAFDTEFIENNVFSGMDFYSIYR